MGAPGDAAVPNRKLLAKGGIRASTEKLGVSCHDTHFVDLPQTELKEKLARVSAPIKLVSPSEPKRDLLISQL